MMPSATLETAPLTDAPTLSVARIEVRPRPGTPDPQAQAVLAQARAVLGEVSDAATARVYLIEAPLTGEQIDRVARELLADPIGQTAVIGAEDRGDWCTIEVHYQPGVMDPVAQSTREAIVEMFAGELGPDQVEVRTGFRYDLATDAPTETLRRFAAGTLANPVIQDIHLEPFSPTQFPHAHSQAFQLTHVTIRDLDDDALMRMSREAHLFLSLDEMRAIRDYYRQVDREPTDVELETLAQTWSEHCVHKTLKSTIRYVEAGDQRSEISWEGRPGHEINADGSITIRNLLKSTVAAATHKLMEEDHFRAWCVSVFVDNAGVVKFDNEHAVCIKVETHNHPSAIEPYGGAATGIGGCIRDVMGTGLAALPIANTDTFCVANPHADELPKGVIPPRRVLQQVVAGVRDYGNRMGIPTVNGAVYFHDDYVANPLVFAGCVGLLPLDKCSGAAKPGDRIIALGGRTGRDGIHGATFSSAELTDTHADEFAHAVQIGNAITQKKTLDVILQARDHQQGCLFNAITDCGAGGFSSAVGEMGADIGAAVALERAPLKYDGLTYTEIWISEAQERMVLAVPPDKADVLRALCEAEDVEFCDLGQFGFMDRDEPTLVLTYHGREVGRLSMHLLHEGIPTPTREATWSASGAVSSPAATVSRASSLQQTLIDLLSHPNIASKHWIIRQYDHEVQGGSVVKPLTGPNQDGPSDAAVIRPKLDSSRGIALGCGLCPSLSEKTPGGDSYWMALAAIDEAVRNVVCVGADTRHIAILDNFCWPRCDDPRMLGSLVRAAEGCYDGALAYRTPFVSGKDSLSNQFTTEDGRLITIPPTLLITAMGIVPDVARCRTMDAKQAGNVLLIVGETRPQLVGSHLAMCGRAGEGNCNIPRVDLHQGPAHAQAVARIVAQGLAASVHDCSDGGLLIAAAEMAFAGGVGLDLDLSAMPSPDVLDTLAACFAETPSRYLLEVAPDRLDRVVRLLRDAGVAFGQIGRFMEHGRLTLRTPRDGRNLDASLDELRSAWLAPLDW
jgi:phosphoribosylformylglycinamidine synthase II